MLTSTIAALNPAPLLDADDQDDGDGHSDQNGGQVEPGQGLSAVLQGHELEYEFLLLEVVVPGRREQPRVQVDIEQMLEHGIEVARPAVGNEAGTDGVLENQVPADDPGDQLTERGVSVRVGTAGHRDHAGQF